MILSKRKGCKIMKEFLPNKDTIFKLSGTPYEIGFKHGSAIKEKVHTSLQTYEKMFYEISGHSWKTACERALLHLNAIEKYNLNYIKEMEGLADGAGVRFEDILTLNSRSEIALVNLSDGCTSFSLAKPKTNKTWLAQNWDWKRQQIDALVHLEIRQNGLPIIQMITEAGIIGKIGCNSAGIGVCLNAIVASEWEAKIPIHLGLRSILESESIEDAISRVNNNQMASSAHFLISSKTGQISSMEVSPVYTKRIFPSDGILTHTNHICSPKMKDKIIEEANPDSYDRLFVIDEQIKSLKKKDIKEIDLFYLLSNHKGYPYSICRHSTDAQSFRIPELETVFSVVMNLTENKLTWIKGKPCKFINENLDE